MPTANYKVNGERVPGVTTIINRFKDAGGLLYWSCQQGQKYPDLPTQEAMRKEAQEAADIGTMAHWLIEIHINGKI